MLGLTDGRPCVSTHRRSGAHQTCTLPRSASWRKEATRNVSASASMTQPPLVVVGSLNADLVLVVDRVPKPGETLGASSLETFPGGKGANQAAAAARLGYPTFFVGQIGQDANAPLLRAALTGCGVDLTHLREVEGPSGTAVILLEKGGENSIIIVGGANQAEWDVSNSITQAVQSAGAILLQREIPESINLHVAKLAKAAGVPVFLDAGGVEGPIDPELLSCISLLSPNESELARLTGRQTDTQEQVLAAAQELFKLGVQSVLQEQMRVLAAAQELFKLGVQSVLVKLGSDGSLLLPGPDAEPVRQLAIKAAQVVDTTGAGDCFTAAYAVAVLEGKVGADALRFASAAASICVGRKGAMPSLPSRQELEPLLA